MIVRYPTAVMARSGGSSLRQLVGSPRHTEEHHSMTRRLITLVDELTPPLAPFRSPHFLLTCCAR